MRANLGLAFALLVCVAVGCGPQARVEKVILEDDWDRVLKLAQDWQEKDTATVMAPWLISEAYRRVGYPQRAEDAESDVTHIGKEDVADLKPLADWTERLSNRHPESAAVWMLRSSALWHVQRYNEAVAAADRALRIDPQNAFAYLHRGRAYHGEKDHERAIHDFDKAIQLNPNLPQAYLWRARAKWDSEREDGHEQAIDDLELATHVYPLFETAFSERAICLHACQRYDEALSDLDRAIALNPNHSYYYILRGDIYEERKDYDRAIREYSKSIELLPIMASSYVYRGDAYFAKGDYESAIADYRRATELYEDSTFAWMGMARAFEKLARTDDAISAWKAALRTASSKGYKDDVAEIRRHLRDLGAE